ncbi:unnamed protein product [Phaeothamnion confervicola]
MLMQHTFCRTPLPPKTMLSLLSERYATRRYHGSSVSMRMDLPRGSLVALITPMTESGEVDVASLRALLEWHVEAGTDGIVVLGTTGEASTLSTKERELVLTVTREEVGGKVPIVAGTGAVDPVAAIANGAMAAACGADACLVVTPYYVKPTQAGLVRFFEHLAARSDLPLVLYNVPGRTGVDMRTETVAAAAAAHPLVAGMKEATGDVARAAALRRSCPPGFLLYSGDDATASQFTLSGGDGVISVTANVVPDLMHRVMAAAVVGDAEEVERLEAPLRLLHDRLFVQSNPIPTKWAAQRMGRIPGGGIRLPLTPLEAAYEAPVEEALRAAGCI